jgi:hypothetical protein
MERQPLDRPNWQTTTIGHMTDGPAEFPATLGKFPSHAKRFAGWRATDAWPILEAVHHAYASSGSV